MKQVLFSFACLLCVSICSLNAQTTTVSLEPEKDNTIWTTGNSNGAGQYIFAGKDQQGRNRRALMKFDVASMIPAGATIISASLTLTQSRDKNHTQTVSIHKLTSDWGEGSSNASGQEGGGATPIAPDATWQMRMSPTTAWSTAGGDFNPFASSSTTVMAPDVAYTWPSTTMTVSDVQDWVNNPANNHGWILINNEAVNTTAKRFNSRENSNASSRPTLTITYMMPSIPCNEPDSLWASRLTPGSARLHWNPTPNAVCYQIRGGRAGFPFVVTLNIAPGAPEVKDVFGLSNQSCYWWQIRTFCDTAKTDSSVWSGIDTFCTNCYPPTNLSTTNISSNGAVLNWSSQPGAAAYEINGGLAGISGGVNIVVGSFNTSKPVFGLNAATAYQWRIRTWCDTAGVRKSAYTPFEIFTTMPFSNRLPNPGSGNGNLDLSFALQPNPGRNEVEIIFDQEGMDNLILSVFNVKGELVQKASYNPDVAERLWLDVSNYSNGLYVVTLQSSTKLVSKRLVIQK